MTKVRVYFYGKFMCEVECDKYEPRPDRNEICKFSPKEVKEFRPPCIDTNSCSEESTGYRCYNIYERRVQGRYHVVVGIENGVHVYVLDSKIATKLKANMLFSYDGVKFIKASGGKAVWFDDLVDVLKMEKQDIDEIKKFFKKE